MRNEAGTGSEFIVLMKAAQLIEDAPALARGVARMRIPDAEGKGSQLVYCRLGAVDEAAISLGFCELAPITPDCLNICRDPRHQMIRNRFITMLMLTGTPTWNDDPSTTKEMVVESLRHLAEAYASPEMLEEINDARARAIAAAAGKAERDRTPTEAQPRETPQAYVETSASYLDEKVQQAELARAAAYQAFKHVRESNGISQDQP